MRTISTGKTINVSFNEDELPLLEAFDRLRKREYSTRSRWIKSAMFNAIPDEEKRQVLGVL